MSLLKRNKILKSTLRSNYLYSSSFSSSSSSSLSLSNIVNDNIIKKDILNVAIVGRPNTGKSTLFNKLTKTRQAIVSNIPGTTRDRKEGKGYLAGIPLSIVDTGGLDNRGAVSINIQEQVQHALIAADVILFMLDAKVGVTSVDEHFAKWIRKQIGELSTSEGYNSRIREVIVLANKTEGGFLNDKVMDTMADAQRLGLGTPIPISAVHGDGLAELSQLLMKAATDRNCDDGSSLSINKKHKSNDKDNNTIINNVKSSIQLEDKTIQLAIMGRPNVGKSTLLNAILGQDRVITGPVPGLTRDSVHVEWSYKSRLFKLVDTAGITHITVDKRKLDISPEENKYLALQENVSSKYDASGLPGIQFVDPEEDPSQFSRHISELALVSALNALRFAQVVLLVIESSQQKFSKIDLQLAQKCLQEGRGLVIAANKKDISMVSEKEYENGVREHCDALMKEFGDVPIIACSGIEGSNLERILDNVILTHDAWSKRIETPTLNRWLKDTLVISPTANMGHKSLKIKYITQVKTRPPTFSLFTNTQELPSFFERFLRARIQNDFKLIGVPIRFIIKKGKGNDVDKSLLNVGKASRRGTGRGEGRPVGPKRNDPIERWKVKMKTDTRRRRNTRLDRVRKA